MARTRARRLPVEERGPLILDAALELLVTRPGETLSMDAIAGQAGVTKPSVYNCFATKSELFDALAKREERRIRELVAGSLAELDVEGPGEEMLASALGTILESVAAQPTGWRLVYPAVAPREPALTRRMLTVRAANLRMTEQLCHQHLQRLGARDSEVKARFLAHMIAGVLDQLIELVLAEDELGPTELARLAAGLITRGESALLE